jgi:hypothetical protein
LASPKCARCLSRSMSCDYSDALPRAVTVASGPGASNFWPASNATSAPGTALAESNEQALSPLNMSDLPDFQMDAMQWENSTMNGAHDLLRDNEPWLQYPFVELIPSNEFQEDCVPMMRDPEPRQNEPDYVMELSRKLYITDFAVIPWPSPQLIPKKFHTLLARRSIEKVGSSLIVNHLFSTINSYPSMLGTSNLPPFIHRFCWSGEMDIWRQGHNLDLPEPLANCLSFIPMFRSKTPASNTFVMKTLFMEAQRLHNEVSSGVPPPSHGAYSFPSSFRR